MRSIEEMDLAEFNCFVGQWFGFIPVPGGARRAWQMAGVGSMRHGCLGGCGATLWLAVPLCRSCWLIASPELIYAERLTFFNVPDPGDPAAAAEYVRDACWAHWHAANNLGVH